MRNIILYCVGGTLALLILLAAISQYNVYQQTLNGKAQLQSAEYTRQTRVLEAKAKAESAALEGYYASYSGFSIDYVVDVKPVPTVKFERV